MQETSRNIKEIENMVSALKELTTQLERNHKVDNKVNTNNTVTLNKTVGEESINLVEFS